jgi:urease subunit alpha
MFGAFGDAPAATSITFLSKAALAAGLHEKLGLKKTAVAVKNCRNIGKKDLIHNTGTPDIAVDPETYEVRIDGHLITCEPATILPLAQRYFLF